MATPAPVLPDTRMDEIKRAPDPPLILSFSAYLDEQTRQIWSTSVAWEGYQHAMLISESDMNEVKKLDTHLRQHASETLQANAESYIQTLYKLLNSLNKDDTVQYLLALTNLLIQDYPKVASKFHDLSKINDSLPYSLFSKFLSKSDIFISNVAAKIFTFLLCSAPSQLPTEMDALFESFDLHLSNTNPQVVDLAIQNIQSLLSVVDLRIRFYTFQGGKLISGLSNMLSSNTNPQIHYQIIYCFWLLSFEKDIAKSIQTTFNLIPALVEIGKGAVKEKVIRVALATFRNLAHEASVENTNMMIGSKLLPLLTIWKQQRQMEDPEIQDDIEWLTAHLKEALQKLSTFDEYSSELKSGKLEWSPAHTSDLFWKQNAARLKENDYELIRILARHLTVSVDPLILAVAAHDLGFYIQYHPAGKKMLQEIGAKHRLMELMSNEDGTVRYQALMAVQKFMTHSWDM